jgi:hypothetical protein
MALPQRFDYKLELGVAVVHFDEVAIQTVADTFKNNLPHESKARGVPAQYSILPAKTLMLRMLLVEAYGAVSSCNCVGKLSACFFNIPDEVSGAAGDVPKVRGGGTAREEKVQNHIIPGRRIVRTVGRLEEDLKPPPGGLTLWHPIRYMRNHPRVD